MTEQIDVNAVKGQLVNIIRAQYKGFIDSLNNYPLHPDLKNNAMFFFNAGFLHLREAVALAEVVAKPINLEPKAEDEIVTADDLVSEPIHDDAA